MKKYFFLIVGLLMAMTSNAQITFLRTIPYGYCRPNYQNLTIDDKMNFYVATDDDVYVEYRGMNADTVILYDATTWQVVETLIAPDNREINMVAKNVFTTDNSYAFVCYNREVIDNDYRNHGYIYDATGNMLADLGVFASYFFPFLLKFSFGYQLMVLSSREGYLEQSNMSIYSLPGQGGNSSVREIPQAAPRSRKFMRDQQVLIEHDDNIYTTEGRLIK